MFDEIVKNVLFLLVGGILPSLLWLWFWLREDDEKPEPTPVIVRTFLYGIAMIPIAIIVQQIIAFSLGDISTVEEVQKGNTFMVIMALTLWAFSEELLKFIAGCRGGLYSKANDEPIDPVIYMITASIGFAAGENVLYMLNPVLEGDPLGALMTGNTRFIGTTLVHVASSATIGVAMALTFGNSKPKKRFAVVIGILLATTLHTAFNLLIIYSNKTAYAGISLVWLCIIGLILVFEKIKSMKIKTKNI